MLVLFEIDPSCFPPPPNYNFQRINRVFKSLTLMNWGIAGSYAHVPKYMGNCAQFYLA